MQYGALHGFTGMVSTFSSVEELIILKKYPGEDLSKESLPGRYDFVKHHSI
jgi:hypothetical protein